MFRFIVCIIVWSYWETAVLNVSIAFSTTVIPEILPLVMYLYLN